MRNLPIKFILAVIPFLIIISCGNDNKKRRQMNALYNDIERANENIRDSQNSLDTWSDEDLDRINPTISEFLGTSITYRQYFHMSINKSKEDIEYSKMQLHKLEHE